jgi:hypothetical protein
MLGVLGGLSFLFAGSSVVDPSAVRCAIARAMVETANEDKKEFNDVDTGGKKPDQLECDRAIALAGQIPVDEDRQRTRKVPSESAVWGRALVVAVVGLGQAMTAFLTARTLSRRARTAALVFAGVGIVFSPMGLLSAVVLVFVVYALAFSAGSRSLWPRPGREEAS